MAFLSHCDHIKILPFPAREVSETEARDFHEDLATRGGPHGSKRKKGRRGGKRKKGRRGGRRKKGKHGQHKRRLAQVPTAARDFDQDLDTRMTFPSGSDGISPPALNGAYYRILRRHSDLTERDSLDREYDLAGRELAYEIDELD